MAIDNKFRLPFKIIGSSSVTGGYTDVLHTTLGPGTEITNWHRDIYGKLDEGVLQSPFTQQWVGGRSHRHVPLNTGSDNSSNRPEAFHTEFIPDGVRFYSHGYLNSPPAYWSRDGLAKRPINIANIANTELYVGNYSKNYEVLQTSGRRITNNLVVDGFEADGVLTTQFITNAYSSELSWYQDGSQLTVSDGTTDIDNFGWAVSIDNIGETVAIGATGGDIGATSSGFISIFKSSSLGWYQDGANLTSSDGTLGSDSLGSSVSLNGDGTILAAGSSFSDVPGTNAGSVVVFKSSSLGWYQDGPQLTSSDGGGDTNDYLGTSVSIDDSGTVIIAGSYSADPVALTRAGSVVVFKSSSLGWYQDGPQLTASSPLENEFLGYSVSVNSDGTVFAAGAYAREAVLVFKSSSLGWYQDGPDLTSSDGTLDQDNFGTSVSINSDGTIIAVGSSAADDGATNRGAVIVFKSSSLGWVQDGPRLTSEDNVGNDIDYLGSSVSISDDGTVIAAGSQFSDSPDSLNGSVVIFKSSSLGWQQDGNQLIANNGIGDDADYLGFSVSINSNGTTIIGGAYRDDILGHNGIGSATIFKYGVVSTLFNTPYLLPELNSESGSKSVIVERFNAPGSKEESSRGALDREGEEMSPNIPLPFRNIKVRQPYYRQLAQHMPQFGSGSTYKLLPDTGITDAVTVHKVNRNRLVRGGIEYFDNWFVQHAIPRTDIQYSWITASAYTTAVELGGYEHTKTLDAYEDIQFVTASLTLGEVEVDNNFLQSRVKDSKSVDITTNTFTVEGSLLASFSEYTNSPYGFAWTSTRMADYPVSRALRSNNLLSVLDKPREIQYPLGSETVTIQPQDTSTNFIEPPVTFKYYPLEYRTSIDNDVSSSASWFYPYTNFFSSYANKSLLERLGIVDNAVTFYDVLQQDIEDGNLIYHGHSYREIAWPKEENTGLKETRQRAHYILDEPGFERDGYDRQLGTQRAFWRDSQTDRKRSNNSDGGYINSLGYLSTEETGSSFTQNEESLSTNNKFIVYSSSFDQYNSINSGLFNSLNILEYNNQEREIYSYNSNIIKQNYSSTGNFIESIDSSNYKRGYIYDLSGEFNILYNDFYEQILEGTNKISLGSLYRNSGYKSLFLSKEDSQDGILLLEDDQIFTNPKIKYVSFIGGVELNTGSFVQDINNFSTNYQTEYPKIDRSIASIAFVGSDLYIGGEFLSIDDSSIEQFAKWNGTSWSEVGGGVNNGDVISLLSVGTDLYVGGSFTSVDNTTTTVGNIAKWETSISAWDDLGGGLNNDVFTLLLSGSDIYAGGQFTSDSAGTIPLRGIAKWNGSSWSEIAGGVTGQVYDSVLVNNNIYFAGPIQAIDPGGTNTPIFGGVIKYNGSIFEQVGQPQGYIPFLAIEKDNYNDIYVPMIGDSEGDVCWIHKWDSTSWSSPGNYIIDFDSYNTGDLINDSTWQGYSTNLIRSGSVSSAYPGKKFHVFNSTVTFRSLLLKPQLSGAVAISYLALVNNSNSIYDPGFLNLENADPGEDLRLQYSFDGSTWVDYATLLTGSLAAGSLGLVQKRETIFVEGLESPYYLRFNQRGASGTGADHYALADITIGNNYFQVLPTAPYSQIPAIKYFNGSLYIGGVFSFKGNNFNSNFLVKLSGSTYYDIDINDDINAFVRTLETSGSNIYSAGYMEKQQISKIAIYDSGSNSWKSIYDNDDMFLFSSDYFNQTFNESDFSFSTLDNGLQRTTEEDSGKKPFFDSYEDFIADIRGTAKDYSIIPEFRISQHMDYYVREQGGNFSATNNTFLELDGSGNEYRSALVETGSFSEGFFSSYLTSDLLKKEEDVRKGENCELENISVTVSGIKKLLPYNGFYPQDRTVQLANLYGDYVDSKLHGGVYSLSYKNDFQYVKNITTGQNSNRSMSSIKYNSNYYIASKDSQFVQIYKINGEEPTSTDVELIEEFNFDYNINGKIQIVEASNGLNLFFSSLQTSSLDGIVPLGAMYHATSSDGSSWSTPTLMQVSGSSEYLTGSLNGNFGYYFDLIIESSDEQEKIIIVAGNTFPTAEQPYGQVYSITGSLENNQWYWSDKNIIYTGTADTDSAGRGACITSCSSGYQMAFCAGNSSLASSGSVFVAKSNDGYNWDTPIIVANGILDDGVINGLIGAGDMKIIDFENKTHIFFAHNGDYNGYTRNGVVFTVTSSADNTWPSVDSSLDKKPIYYRDLDLDEALSLDGYNISVFSGSDSRLYYSFANPGGVTINNEIVFGFYRDGVYQETENSTLLNITEPLSLGNRSFKTVCVCSYTLNNNILPVFFTDFLDPADGYSIATIKNNIFTEFTLKVSGSEKYYKHAALEPFFAPGILYNTIKSGIAVDWPCATGSQTSIQPYGSNSIVNAYYPQAFQMASYSGSVVQESSYGLLRSNIDYRIPFERLIFPDDAFVAKPFQQTDLVEITPIEALSDNSEVVRFIDKNYIYGGYEPYISPVDFSDIDNTGPKRFSVPFVYRKQGYTDSGLYSLAMSNFLAETVRFFLEGKKMVTFVSNPDSSWLEFIKDKTYYMDVVIRKSPDLVMMEAYHSDLHPTGSNGEKMHGRYFGYPVNKTDKQLWGEEEFTADEARLIHNDPAYAPYTPPYFEGETRVRISYYESVGRKQTLDEIIANSTVENIFTGVSLAATTGSDAYINAMPVQSSINLFGFINPGNVTYNETTGERIIENDIGQAQWTISPYMETPVLDFSEQSLIPYENSYSKTSGFGRGMWSGYGSIPTADKGIFISLEESYPTELTELNDKTGSLLQHVGFDSTKPKAIGQLADNKIISEAVVLIPYLESERDNTTEILDGYHFINIDKNIFERTKNREITGVTSISGMLQAMKKYVIPPQLNFLEYDVVNPFVMYIVEFTDTLSKQDLADIWQGLMPERSYTAELEKVSISHPTGENEFFHGKQLPTGLRWMVFKVKQRGEADYFKVTADSSDDARFQFSKNVGRDVGIYSYNWPYDFFSLVEFAKVELKLDYKN